MDDSGLTPLEAMALAIAREMGDAPMDAGPGEAWDRTLNAATYLRAARAAIQAVPQVSVHMIAAGAGEPGSMASAWACLVKGILREGP
jgi:hypothetical protein